MGYGNVLVNILTSLRYKTKTRVR